MHTMNSSVMPLMPLGSSLSVPSSLSVLSSSRGLGRLGAFQLSWRKEAHDLSLVCTICSLASRWFHHLFLFSLPCCPKIIRVHLFIGTGLQVGYHRLGPFRQITVEVVMLQLSDVVWWKAFWGWCCKKLEVPLLTHPQSDTVSYLPICNWKVPGSKCVGLWHCCNVHPVWQAHCLRWCLSLNFLPTLPGNLVGYR